MVSRILLVMLLAAPTVMAQGRGGGASGSGAPEMLGADPTPFELFVDKLTLETDQLKDIQRFFGAAVSEASPVSREMVALREKMLAAESAGKADEFAAAASAYATAAAKMAAIEIKAFKQAEGVLKPKQLSKSAEAFVMIAGIFNQPSPKLNLMMNGRGRGDR